MKLLLSESRLLRGGMHENQSGGVEPLSNNGREIADTVAKEYK